MLSSTDKWLKKWRNSMYELRHFSPVQLFETLWNVFYQALLSMGFSRQEYWSGFPCPTPGCIYMCVCVFVYIYSYIYNEILLNSSSVKIIIIVYNSSI